MLTHGLGFSYIGKIPKKRLGYFAIILSAALAALVHVMSKPLLGSPDLEEFTINPIMMAAVIYIINGIFFTPFVRNTLPLNKIGSKNLILIAFIGIAEVSGLITYFFGLKESTAINASIFSNGEIIFSLLIAITVFKERLQRKELTPFSMIIFGMLILPVSYDFYENGMSLNELVIGDLIIIFSGLLYALDVNASKYVSDRFDSKRIAQISSFVAGVFALGLVVAFQIPYDMITEKIFDITFIAILGTGISTLLFLISLRLLGSMRTVMLYSTTAIFGIVFSSIILSEQITLPDVVSISLVMIGVYLLRKRLSDDISEKNNLKLKKLKFKKHSGKFQLKKSFKL